jgi:protein-S-isoprenylcysteine O-methyltransferase Ste14
VEKRQMQREMYELPNTSRAPRLTLTGIAGLWLAVLWWLLLFGGLAVAARWCPWIGKPGDGVRRALLVTGFSIYYTRILFTQFVFLKRGMSWSEAFTVGGWLLFIFLVLGLAGGTNPAAFGAAGGVGIILFLLGSWINSYAEYSRHVWKQRPENRGQLYTGGLFRYSRHPNYFGDLVLFSGLCLIAGAWLTAIVPLLMLAVFVFVNIPVLDSHLHDHYGRAFDEYARRTRKLIPFVY